MNHYDRSENSNKVWNKILASVVWNCNYFLFAMLKLPQFVLYQQFSDFLQLHSSARKTDSFRNYLPVKLSLSYNTSHMCILYIFYLFSYWETFSTCSNNALCACTMNLRHTQAEMRSTKYFESLVTSWIRLKYLFVCWNTKLRQTNGSIYSTIFKLHIIHLRYVLDFTQKSSIFFKIKHLKMVYMCVLTP